jgi:hypothetical protein
MSTEDIFCIETMSTEDIFCTETISLYTFRFCVYVAKNIYTGFVWTQPENVYTGFCN